MDRSAFPFDALEYSGVWSTLRKCGQTPLTASTTVTKAGSLSALSLNSVCLMSFKNFTIISHMRLGSSSPDMEWLPRTLFGHQ
jgi:hypothetical protein